MAPGVFGAAGNEPGGASAGVMAQQVPAAVIARLREIDAAVSPQQLQDSWALLTPYHEKAGYTAPRIVRDLRYGEHPRHRLDVHTAGPPAGTGPRAGTDAGRAPVIVFVHGGGFTGGDKRTPGTPRYDLVGAWAVRHGWVGVTMTHRLAPEFKWPAGAQDVAAAVAWLRASVAGYGGDPDRIIVTGNSAGAAHVAGFVAGHGGGRLDGVRGAALLSGIYQARAARPDEPEHAYYGPGPGPETASLPGLLRSPVPLLFSVAERDGPAFHAAAASLVTAWMDQHGTLPNLVWVEGHNHMSTVGSLTVDETALGVPLARFIDRHAGQSLTKGR
jgi:acetyl esterase/lipase